MLMTLRVSGARISVHQGGGRDAGLETPGPNQAPRIIPQGGSREAARLPGQQRRRW